MNLILKQGLIIGVSFMIILWFQTTDDKKNNRVRKTFYEQYKFPILVSSIVGLLINLPEIINLDNSESTIVENVTDVTIIAPSKNCEIESEFARPFINNNNFGMDLDTNKLSWFGNNNKMLSNQQIFTDLPDF